MGWADQPLRTFEVWDRKQTNSEGRAEWALPPGEYRFRLNDVGLVGPESWRMADTVWTSTGPVNAELRL